MSTSATTSRSVQLPPAWVTVGTAYAVCVLGPIARYVADIVLTDNDWSRSPIENIFAYATFGTATLVIGVGLALCMVRTPGRARVGTFVLLTLSVLAMILFWTGAPGILGACTAWCAGLTRGARPLDGGARVAGIIGVFIALLIVATTVVAVIAGPRYGLE